MKKLFILSLLLLSACKEEMAQSTDPVALTAETIGHYCQMNLTEHPGPKAQVHLEGLPGAPLFFSQVSDAIAYARLPERDHKILAIWVNDMGAPAATWEEPGRMNWTGAETALYVIGSSRTGGMGAAELVPFADRSRALAFAADYGGTVVTLDQVPDDAVIAPQGDTIVAGDDPDFDARLRALSHSHEGG
ncbi:nitrous oxide reductase accessory protein NosL [Rhodobacteraceae bacterium HSP-20]|uniref:Nitrous oxide reductase accessory protein NosL n=1 Tax=Paragemmobacter amnigenus TaxID=2852097 RepID=A0ABS6J1P1_9RHOB|nr:nitrous oxide reductase accessory protein NosL [Rhodobacter amnigenus]MBU9697671.1 nitrous oxide reductase accessory protein NosL [Rhodobacter amnigenus]MBV4388898.1 nitrous oxide reductase accessory protein NosL [Rhodobacter amnigenus]